MARQLPTIKPAPSPKNETLGQKKRMHRSSSIDNNPQKTKLNRMVEARLAKQFQYFRAEFLEHALSIGIPVPLDMAEDKNGKVMTFVNQKGPRYLLNIIHAYPESVHLLRSSLSFLIVIIAILTSKIKHAEDNELVNVVGNSVHKWASEALASIADSSSVAICTNLLRHSHSEAIQELILNLLAQLVCASPEAAAQMMHRPQVNAGAGSSSSEPQANHSGNSNPSSPREGASSTATVGGGTNDPDGMTCLSYMFSVVSHNRNRYTVMTSCAEVCLALLKDKSGEVSEAMARTWISRLPLVKPGDSKIKERYIGGEESSESNKSKPKEKRSKGKSLSVLTRKAPTTALSRGTSAKKQIPPPTHTTRGSTPRQRVSNQDENPNEWAAFKVLLKFLHRFMRYGSSDSLTSTPRSDPSNSQGGFNNVPFGDIDDESLGDDSARGERDRGRARARVNQNTADKDDIVPHKHKKALYNAHSRVLLVVVELVSNSPAVAKFILSMPGACAILKSSCAMHKDSPIGEKVMTCLRKLQGETDTLFKKEMTQHHSMSFELTHGKSAKLFNPVSPIARRESAMLSPERCGIVVQESQGAGGDAGDGAIGRCKSQGGSTPKARGKSRVGSMMFAEVVGDGLSRPSSRSGLIPLGQLFSSEERKYLQIEENKRVQQEQERMRERDFFDEDDEGGEEEGKVVEDDSWFLNSFYTEDDKKTKRKGRPPRIHTSFDGAISSSRPPSSQQRPVSSQPPRTPAEPYNPPESPIRRGLGAHNGGSKGQKDPSESLHRSLFTNLPELPDMPIRLEAETIINDCNAQYKDDLLERSTAFTSSVVDIAYRDGFYRDGRNNIPISERARRVYVPDMQPFQGEADRHPNLLTAEYLEEQRNRPKSQGSVLGERSAKVRATNNRVARELKNKSQNKSLPSTPSKRSGTHADGTSYQDVFSDYYQGLLPLNGVGEIEPESKFQLFLVQKQQVGTTRASTAPASVRQRGDEQCDDSLTYEDSTTFEEHSKGYASYASSLSKDVDDGFQLQEGSQSQCDGSLITSDWKRDEHEVLSRPPPPNQNEQSRNGKNGGGAIVQSVDMLFP